MPTTARGKFASVALLTSALLVAACATPYGPSSGSFTGGYSESKLQKDRYNVSFEGNAWISEEQAMNYLLYRCAEITLDNGFDYFIIVSEESNTSYSTMGKGAVPHPNLEVMIQLRNGPPPSGNPDAYDARELKQNLEAKIAR